MIGIIKKYIRNVLFRYKVVSYNLRKHSIEKKVFSKDKIRVVFFVLYDNMWKSDDLFKKLSNHDRFDPYIISSPYPHHPRKFSEENQNRVERFFRQKNFPFINGYSFQTDTWFDIKSFKPDIVFYQQPYNSGYHGFKIESLWKNCLFGYIPYTYELEDDPEMLNHLLPNIAWRVFLPSEEDVKLKKTYLITNGLNLVASGHPLADTLAGEEQTSVCLPWKDVTKKYKRIIWAPHHSILDTDKLNYSNFLEIADGMLELANKYRDSIQFAFKPHPVLKRKLYKLDGWGINKTDDYYAKWANSSNSILVEGDYSVLFNSSDGMIHDCSTFTVEYLYTQKPVMYLSKQGRRNCFNEFGVKCYEQHYIGHNLDDISSFLKNVILLGNDPKASERKLFYQEYLLPPNGQTAAQNMFDEFLNNLRPNAKR